jgi:hypothetical protein
MIHRQLHKAERAGIAKRRCIAGGMGLEGQKASEARFAGRRLPILGARAREMSGTTRTLSFPIACSAVQER